MCKNVDENISKNVSSKCSQKLPDHNLKLLDHSFNTASKKAIQKRAEASGDVIGNNISNIITKVSRNLQHNTSRTVQSETEIPKERYISPEKKQKSIDDLRLIS